MFQGFDVEGEDVREVVQNVIFGSSYAVAREEMSLVSLDVFISYIKLRCHLRDTYVKFIFNFAISCKVRRSLKLEILFAGNTRKRGKFFRGLQLFKRRGVRTV